MKGGPRPGSGRKPGSKNKRTKDVAAKAAADGVTPADVMLGAMRALWDAAAAETDAAKKLTLLRAASEEASRAAPYIHPRLSAVEAKVNANVRNFAVSGEPITEQEWQDKYAAGNRLGTPARPAEGVG